jgi:hypothetical protein
LFEDDTPAKRHSNETTRKYMKTLTYQTSSINVMLLAKLGMVGDKGGTEFVRIE